MAEPAANPPGGTSSREGPDLELEQAQTVISKQQPLAVGGPVSVPVAPIDAARVLLGHSLGHYQLNELVGGGGMGAVFRAHDPRLDRVVAVKVLPRMTEDPDLLRRFRNEALNAARLDHPHIARVYDVGEADGWYYIVFEFIEGTNLRDLVKTGGPLSIDDTVYYVWQVADALAHASDRGVVHRDIKPSNVLITDSGQVKLVDMGLARSQQLEAPEDVTASGVTLGTFDYISPEQARDPRDADTRSDLYSLGCTCFYMLTGQPPFAGGTALQKLLSHGSIPPPDVRQLRDDVSPELAAILRKLMAKRPAARYQRPVELMRDLQVLAAREGLTRSLSASNVVLAPEPWELHAWHRLWPWLVGLAAILLIALSLHWSGNGRDAASLSPAAIDQMYGTNRGGTGGTTGPTDAQNVQVTDGARGPSSDRNGDGPPRSAVANPTSDADRDSTAGPTGPEEGRAAGARPNVSAEPTAQPTLGGSSSDGKSPSGEPVESTPPSASQVDGGRAEEPAGRLGDTSGDRTAAAPERARETGATESRPTATAQTRIIPEPPLVRVYVARAAARKAVPGERIVDSLDQAMRLAGANPSVTEIELAAGEWITEPFRFPRSGLRIVGNANAPTVLRVLLREPVPAMERPEMIDFAGCDATLIDLHIVWEVPSEAVDGGTLFRLAGDEFIVLRRCSITIRQPADRPNLYAFQRIERAMRPGFGTMPPGGVRSDETDGGPKTVANQSERIDLQLEDSIVRGQLTMIDLPTAIELHLRWNNGLLAVTRRLLESGGAAERSPLGAVPLDLQLEHVTLRVPRGVAELRLGPSGAYPLDFRRDCRDCVFSVDAEEPLLRLTNSGAERFDIDRLISLSGDRNAYDLFQGRTNILLAVSEMGGMPRRWSLGDIGMESTPWFSERLAVSSSWIGPPTTPADRQRPEEFRQRGVEGPGFIESRLPMMPPDPAGP